MGVAKLVVAVVRERDVTRAALVEFFHARQIFAERVTVLDAHERGFFTLGVDAANVVGAQGQFHLLLRDLTSEAVNRVEFFHSGSVSPLVAHAFERVRILTFPGLADVNDEEQRVETAVDHVGQIELGLAALGVVTLAGQIFGLEIDVRVENEDAIMNRASLLRQLLFNG